METISIIVPVYNAEATLDGCLSSILSQTYRELEIILVNDGSKDSSLAICNKYSLMDSRIRVIDGKNEGVSKARNKGLSFAHGRFIGFVDADDWIDPDMFQLLYLSLTQTSNCTMAVIGVHANGWDRYLATLCNDQVGVDLSVPEALDEITKRDGLKGYVWNKLFWNRQLLFDEEITVCEDLEFVMRYLTLDLTGVVRVINHMSYNYIVPENYSFSHVRYGFERGYSIIIAYRKIIENLKEVQYSLIPRIKGYICQNAYDLLIAWYSLPPVDRIQMHEISLIVPEMQNAFTMNYRYGLQVATTKQRIKLVLARYIMPMLILMLKLKQKLGIVIN